VNAVKTFVPKFANDWSINLAGMLTYSLITAIVPLLLGILSIAGLALNTLSPSTLHSVAAAIGSALPSGTQSVINPDQLVKNLVQITGPLAIVSLVSLLWTGSNLFTNVENAFSIVFRTKDREFIPQRVMAIGMIVILALLLPTALLASSLVTAGSQAFQSFLPKQFGVVLSVVGPLVSLVVLWVLFLAIYIVVPNMKIPFRNAWRGALVAAALVAIVNLVFPLYATVFLNGNGKYSAILPTLLVLIIYLWFFDVILIIGAQVNAVSMGLEATQYDLARTFAQDYAAGRAHAQAPTTRRAPLPRRALAGLGHAAGAMLGVSWRLVAPALRALALAGWLIARPFMRARRRGTP